MGSCWSEPTRTPEAEQPRGPVKRPVRRIASGGTCHDRAVCDIEVRQASPGEWPAIKDTRLRALADSPDAFASTLAHEAGFDDAEWQGWTARGNWFLARHSGRVIGIAAIKDGAESDQRHLISLWVEPGHRGTPAAASLVEAACEQARARGATAITLWVTDHNLRARRFYERLGFHPTGARQPLPSNPGLTEQQLRLLLPIRP